MLIRKVVSLKDIDLQFFSYLLEVIATNKMRFQFLSENRYCFFKLLLNVYNLHILYGLRYF